MAKRSLKRKTNVREIETVTKTLTRKQEYQKYLYSKEWKQRRNKLKDIVGNKCEYCDKTEGLQIHHLNYDCLGKETLNDVVCLCAKCHLKTHSGKLKIFIFNKEEMECFSKIRHIIFKDERIEYLIRLTFEDVKIDDIESESITYVRKY